MARRRTHGGRWLAPIRRDGKRYRRWRRVRLVIRIDRSRAIALLDEISRILDRLDQAMVAAGLPAEASL